MSIINKLEKKQKETGKALVKWEEEFKNLAKETSKGIEVGTGKFISFHTGMKFNGADIEDDEIRCVIIGWTNHNAYYEPGVRFDPKNSQTPICYAFGQEKDEMQPHEASSDKQCGSCAECPFNQFESAESGKGKACKNTFRLALIAESDLENLEEAEVVYASIPPMSLKNFSNYLGRDLDKLERPHWSVITLMKRLPDGDSQFRVTFKHEENIEDAELFGPLKELWTKTMEGIDFPYVKREAPPAKNKVAGKGSSGKVQKFARK